MPTGAGQDWGISGNVRRPRLVERGSAGRVVMVEAPSGGGKTTLLGQLRADHDGPVIEATLTRAATGRAQLSEELRRSLHLHGLSDLAAAAARTDDLAATLLRWSGRNGERFQVQIDDIHLASDDLDRAVAQLCDTWPAPHRLVLAGRRLPRRTRACLAGTDSVLIGADDLRLRPDEARAILVDAASDLDDADVAAITTGCDGWPAAVELAAARLGRTTTDDALREQLRVLTERPATVEDLLGSLLEPQPTAIRDAVARLASLPVWDDDLARTVGLDGVASLADLGLPLTAHRRGTWSFTNVTRDVLRTADCDPPLAHAAVERYTQLGFTSAALEVLSAPQLEPELARFLTDLPPALLPHLELTEHAAAVASLPRSRVAADPRILLHLADSAMLVGDHGAYVEAIGRAVALVEGRPTVARVDAQAAEVRAVALTVQMVARNDDGLVAEAEALLADPDLPPMAWARLEAAIGRATASRRTAPALRAGARRLDDAAQAFDRLGASVHALATRLIAATYASLPLGRYHLALEQLEQALAAAPGDGKQRVATLPYLAFALVDLGRYAEAEGLLVEVRRTASDLGLLGNERAAAFARWATARMASQRGDGEAAWAACRAVERSDVTVDTGDGAFFRADAAQLLARVGWFDDAERLLADARRRDPGNTGLVEVAEFAVAAYRGDLDRADASLTRLEERHAIEPRDRWRVTLLHAAVCDDVGDRRAAALAAAAFEEAAQLGHPDLPLIQEPTLARRLLPLAERGSASARETARSHGAHVRVLGGFDVERDGRLTEPAGRPAQLLALLALNDRHATVDQAIETLWPDGDPDRGRERLRTVLRRVRRDHGDLVERHDDLLRLVPEVTIDLEEFVAFCRQAREAAGDRERAATAALALHRGEPVPSLAHLDWVARARRHIEDHALAAHDAIVAVTTADGRLDDALRSLSAALELDPVAEERYLEAARLLAEQGRRARALQLLSEARAALDDVGLEVGPELIHLERYLARNPAIDTARAS